VGRKKSNQKADVSCGLTLEDEFVLTRIRARAHELTNPKDRDQFFWAMVFKLVCRERAYKTVMEECGIAIETNVTLFDGDSPAVED
jgi:hypothetical protein